MIAMRRASEVAQTDTIKDKLDTQANIIIRQPNAVSRTVFQCVSQWDCPVFVVHEELQSQLMLVVGFALFTQHGLVDDLCIDLAILQSALIAVSSGYHEENPFHNHVHATDVAISSSYMIAHTVLEAALSPQEKFISIFSALCHDFDHPGVTNNFLIATQHPLSLRYNDQSVLENHHVCAVLSLLSMREETDLLGCFPDGQRKSIRTSMIQVILATDLAQNFATVAEFKRKFKPPERMQAAMVWMGWS